MGISKGGLTNVNIDNPSEADVPFREHSRDGAGDGLNMRIISMASRKYNVGG